MKIAFFLIATKSAIDTQRVKEGNGAGVWPLPRSTVWSMYRLSCYKNQDKSCGCLRFTATIMPAVLCIAWFYLGIMVLRLVCGRFQTYILYTIRCLLFVLYLCDTFVAFFFIHFRFLLLFVFNLSLWVIFLWQFDSPFYACNSCHCVCVCVRLLKLWVYYSYTWYFVFIFCSSKFMNILFCRV